MASVTGFQTPSWLVLAAATDLMSDWDADKVWQVLQEVNICKG